ncbi:MULTISPECIES: hypothetical protein [unclassified Acinetobacter]|uniref:hypothetical protein n=1 Tax=unclassified Acinetobacter TaxID=196816 RepID=UPI0024483E4C|nr:MULTISPECIES: hypothetical protein [unclassified Acinetobacter]MDH0031359.1 hypothetical protein [Acinetobacter sp. GD04021]MDH0887156.1 hypothetical protein [Acinetobacter sp. GD03873]MDH1083555.1 hypothetical protein [Acinetobacter sp. GD03983]MDH2190472.1 hypothetical protein [Acinetobacter sp. GD03645]MDH2204082.1 hypothetical protein [Acinetobacter sp. GD03647]
MSSLNLPEHKQVQAIQSWYEPALTTLERMLEVRKENLRKIKRDENQAAVTREEFMEALNKERRMPLYEAGKVVSSLYHAKKIIMFGRFIQIVKDGEA